MDLPVVRAPMKMSRCPLGHPADSPGTPDDAGARLSSGSIRRLGREEKVLVSKKFGRRRSWEEVGRSLWKFVKKMRNHLKIR